MKAVLYAVETGNVTQWRVSLDPSLKTDITYWTRCDSSVRLLRHTELLPFGRALAEAGRLQSVGASVELIYGDKLVPAAAQSGVMSDWTDEAGDADSEAAIGRFGKSRWSGHTDQEDLERLADKLGLAMAGRSLLSEEIASLLEYIDDKSASDRWRQVVQLAYLTGAVEFQTGIRNVSRSRWWGLGKKEDAECRRCGSSGSSLRWTECAACGELCAYCEVCLTMGRARTCTPLFLGRVAKGSEEGWKMGKSSYNRKTSTNTMELGDLRLSPAQAAAAEAGLRFLEGSSKDEDDKKMMIATRGMQASGDAVVKPLRRFLIWAVTGAGKTEMMFPLIAAERGRGGRVLIATPRKDVVLELMPRVQAAFAGHRVAALYGGSVQRWESADITVATTHQLLRYEAAFDLVVLDEVDAFPYHNNSMLEHAARKACKPGGAFVLLSATPPEALQRDARSGRLPCVKVPVRYHRHPLPVPALAKPGRLAALLRQSLERGAQAFVFVPQIARLEPELRRLRQLLAAAHAGQPGLIEATSSQDPGRAEKVLRFRTGEIRVLLTTTILERGVTIPKADVCVLDADSRLFDAAALIQMAGRAGRSAKDPYGQVHFLARQRTRAQVEAVRQIRAMNRLAKRSGYLNGRENVNP